MNNQCKTINEKLLSEIITTIHPREIKEILETALKKDFLRAREKLLGLMLEYGLSGLDIIKEIQKLNDASMKKELEQIDFQITVLHTSFNEDGYVKPYLNGED